MSFTISCFWRPPKTTKHETFFKKWQRENLNFRAKIIFLVNIMVLKFKKKSWIFRFKIQILLVSSVKYQIFRWFLARKFNRFFAQNLKYFFQFSGIFFQQVFGWFLALKFKVQLSENSHFFFLSKKSRTKGRILCGLKMNMRWVCCVSR